MKKQILLLVLSFFAAISLSRSQNIEIAVTDMPLNKVFIELRDTYNLKFSYNEKLLSAYKVSVNSNFSSAEDAVGSLIKGFHLIFLKQGDIFIILPEKKIQQTKNFSLSGQVIESGTNESLPFATLFIEDRIVSSDLNGSFSLANSKDSIFNVKISYLGHHRIDTTVQAGNYRFKLNPSNIGLNEIVIKGEGIDYSSILGDKAGAMKINNQIARFLAGNDDNSVFNLLRLMPGVLASSEQSNGLVLWGSYEGLSQVSFDGFTIWGLKSFNDDINSINPLITKDMQVFKGGYDASNGDRVGGIVRISGKSGNYSKPSFTFNINNVTMNGVVETPLWHNSSILLSFRQTYYNQFKEKNIPTDSVAAEKPRKGNSNGVKNFIDYTVFPDYNFHDANFKFTTKNDKGDLFYISLLGGEDQFNSKINQTAFKTEISRMNSEKNIQTGASAFYGNTWGKGNISNYTVSWSSLQTNLSDLQQISRNNNAEVVDRDYLTTNFIKEYSATTDNWFSLNKSNRIEAGGGFVMNNIGLDADSSGINQTSLNETSKRFHAFLQDHISLPGNLNFTAGLRGDYSVNLEKVFIQPRLSASLGLTDEIKVSAAWGKYNQFIAKSSVLDELGNYRYIWTNCNNEDVPVLNSEHWVAGSSFKKNNFTISLEAYSKMTTGLTRFINLNQDIRKKVYEGEGRSQGIDLFVRKDYRGHTAWFSYTVSKTEEIFPYFLTPQLMRAPQDQRHELKGAVILDFKPLSFSANYVYGSGFPLNTGTAIDPVIFEPDYNRLDVAVIYRFRIANLRGESGVSIMNVLDSQNIRYSNFEKVPLDQLNSINIYSEAVPFSPRFSLKIAL